jgi:hypothetical protein
MNSTRSFAPCLAPRFRIAFVLIALLAVTACGGDDSDGQPAGGSQPASLDAFRFTLEARAIGVLGGAGEGGGPEITTTVNGEVAGPTREHTTTKMSLGSSAIELERIRFDDRVWSRSAGHAWTPDQGNSPAGTAGIQLDNAALIGPESNARLRSTLDGLPATDEKLDGKDTRRYTIGAVQLRTILGLPADAVATSIGRIEGDSTLWVTKDAMLPVRLETEALPTSGGKVQLVLNLKDHNARDIKVEPPASG